MAYSYTLGPQYTVGAQKMQHIVITADAATGSITPFAAGTQVLGVTANSRGATAHAWGISYTTATGVLAFVGGGAVTVDVLAFMP